MELPTNSYLKILLVKNFYLTLILAFTPYFTIQPPKRPYTRRETKVTCALYLVELCRMLLSPGQLSTIALQALFASGEIYVHNIFTVVRGPVKFDYKVKSGSFILVNYFSVIYVVV